MFPARARFHQEQEAARGVCGERPCRRDAGERHRATSRQPVHALRRRGRQRDGVLPRQVRLRLLQPQEGGPDPRLWRRGERQVPALHDGEAEDPKGPHQRQLHRPHPCPPRLPQGSGLLFSVRYSLLSLFVVRCTVLIHHHMLSNTPRGNNDCAVCLCYTVV